MGLHAQMLWQASSNVVGVPMGSAQIVAASGVPNVEQPVAAAPMLTVQITRSVRVLNVILRDPFLTYLR